MKFYIKTLKDKSFITRLGKIELEENETSINYLIALSILESNSRKNKADKLVMQEIQAGLIDGLITDSTRPRAYTESGASIIGGVVAEHSHYLSAMVPAAADESEPESRSGASCCRRFWNRICKCKN